jgi:hypothetical protein
MSIAQHILLQQYAMKQTHKGSTFGIGRPTVTCMNAAIFAWFAAEPAVRQGHRPRGNRRMA